MEWKTIQPEGKAKPSGRWGHSCCIVDGALYLFGGFKHSYMNDLWRYSYLDRTWNQLHMGGSIPEPRSNASLFYDQVHNQLVLYGGGGTNKQRFSGVYLLELTTLNWRKMDSQEDEAAPWGRTYHSAEFKHPFLVVFGGQACDDLDDLWAYHITDQKWREIKLEHGPSPRKFHSSTMLGNNMFVFGGCSGDYQCKDQTLYSLDLSGLWNRGEKVQAEWEQHQLQGAPIESRWGHSMTTYQGHILLYGGRARWDESDLFLISPQSLYAQKLEAVHKQSKRRKANGGMVGSCFVLFGGFNNHYFDDFFYIDLSSLKTSIQRPVLGDYRTAKMHRMVWKECLEEVETGYHGSGWLSLNGATSFKIDLQLASRSSAYIKQLVKWGREGLNDLPIRIQGPDELTLRVLVAFMHTQRLILPIPTPLELLYQVANLASYLCINPLTTICQQELIDLVVSDNRKRLHAIAEDLNFGGLREACAWSEIEETTERTFGILNSDQEEDLSGYTWSVYEERRFELAHRFGRRTKACPRDDSKLFASFDWSVFEPTPTGII